MGLQCASCDKTFKGTTYWQRFCSPTCRRRLKMRRYRSSKKKPTQ